MIAFQRRHLLLLSAVVLVALLAVGPVNRSRQENIGQLSLTVKATPGNVSKLSLILKNDSQRPVTLYQHSLPWESHYAILLVGIVPHVDEQPLHILPGPIDDPTDKNVTLKSGDELRGEIQIDQRLSGFSQALSRGDVILFWRYEPAGPGPDLPALGGWLSIPGKRR